MYFDIVFIQVEELSQWRLKRVIMDENDRIIEFVFPTQFHLTPGQQIRVYAQGKRPEGAGDFELRTEKSWGEGEDFQELHELAQSPRNEHDNGTLQRRRYPASDFRTHSCRQTRGAAGRRRVHGVFRSTVSKTHTIPQVFYSLIGQANERYLAQLFLQGLYVVRTQNARVLFSWLN